MVVKEASDVLTKTTKPQVIIQTKKLNEDPDPSEKTRCGHSHGGKWMWKLFIVLLLLINMVFSFLAYFNSKEQLRFTIMSNGGIENYQMLQTLYKDPAFQQASTLSIYQLMERIHQTLASVQTQGEENPASIE